MTDAQFMWWLRLAMPPPSPGEVVLAQWNRSKGKPFLTRVRLSFSTAWIRETLDELWPAPTEYPT